ncbi:MAG: hypothetical protein ACFE91_16885 [Promethearchaeota archaeon]
MAVYQKNGNFIDYCHKIRELCRNELDPKAFSNKLIQVLKNINEYKEKAKLKFSLYIIEKSNDY